MMNPSMCISSLADLWKRLSEVRRLLAGKNTSKKNGSNGDRVRRTCITDLTLRQKGTLEESLETSSSTDSA